MKQSDTVLTHFVTCLEPCRREVYIARFQEIGDFRYSIYTVSPPPSRRARTVLGARNNPIIIFGLGLVFPQVRVDSRGGSRVSLLRKSKNYVSKAFEKTYDTIRGKYVW